MRVLTSLSALTTLALAACGGGAAGPPGLSYGLPQTTSVRYVSGDTATMDIDAGGQAMQSRIVSSTTFGTEFARAQDGLRVSMTVREMDARVSHPMGTATADAKGISGPLVFTMDRRGAVTLVSQPELDDTAREFFSPLAVAHGFFPRLPGRAAAMGDAWADTIAVDGPQSGGSMKSMSVFTYTVLGDSAVAGATLLKLGVSGTSESTVQGVTTGMDFTQNLTGTVNGWVLWDVQRGLMVESYAESDARGTMDVAAAPFPLGVRVRAQSRTKLLQGM